MSSKACSKCKQNVTPKQNPGIVCVGDCKQPRHWKCTGLTPEEQKIIIDKKLSWTCQKCKRRSVYLIEPQSPHHPQPSSSNQAASTGSNSSDVIELRNQIAHLTSLLQAAVARIESLEKKSLENSAEVSKVAAEVNRIEATSDNIEKHLIDDNLEVQNLSEVDLEDPVATTINLGEAIGCPVVISDFKSTPFVDRRRLRLSFKCKVTRRKFLLAGKQFNRSQNRFNNRKIHVNEELTLFQHRLFEAAQIFKHANNFKFCWFGSSGKLLLKKDETSQLHVIHSIESLSNENLLSECERPTNEVTGGTLSNTAQ